MDVNVDYESIGERMSAAARELQDQHDPASTVKNAVELLVRNVDGCDSASISLVHGRKRVETPAASDDLAATGDRLQAELNEGPALSTLWDEDTVYIPNLPHDPRWPSWGPRLTEATDARSVLTFRLFTIKDTIGALSMYSTKPDAFSAEDKVEGMALAAHIAIAVIASQKLDHYATALDSRTIIAQACGLVMERYDIDAVQAFALPHLLRTERQAARRGRRSPVDPPPSDQSALAKGLTRVQGSDPTSLNALI